MPVIARFYGLIIKMFFQQSEHAPPHSTSYMGIASVPSPSARWR